MFFIISKNIKNYFVSTITRIYVNIRSLIKYLQVNKIVRKNICGMFVED